MINRDQLAVCCTLISTLVTYARCEAEYGGEEDMSGVRLDEYPDGAQQQSPANNTEFWFFNHLLQGYDKAAYPNFHDKGVPTNVTCDIYIRSFGSISATDMEFTVDVYLRQSWRDVRLAQSTYPHTFRLNDERLIRRLWRPDTYFPDVKRATFHQVTVPNMGMILHPNGSILYSARLTMTFACNMNLRFFPFDVQKCYIEIGSYFHTEDQIKLLWKETKPVEFSPHIAAPQLTIIGYTTNETKVIAYSGVYSGLKADIVLQRQFGYDLIQTYLPSFMVVAISWVSVWLDVDAIPARTTLGVTTLLTITTQSSGVRTSLPPVSYVKAVDVWLGMCTFFVFGVLLEFTYTNYLSRKRPTKVRRSKSQRYNPRTGHQETWLNVELDGNLRLPGGDSLKPSQSKYVSDYVSEKRKQAIRVDMMARFIFPITFLIFNIIYWPYYLLSPQN